MKFTKVMFNSKGGIFNYLNSRNSLIRKAARYRIRSACKGKGKSKLMKILLDLPIKKIKNK